VRPHPLRFLGRFALSAAVAACVLAGAGQAPAAFPGRNGLIAYTADCFGVSRIGLMRPDGTGRGLLNVGGRSCGDWSVAPDRVFMTSNPSWAADGRHILFGYEAVVGERGGAFAVAQANGAHRVVVPLAPPPSLPDFGVAFSREGASFAPDGRRFVYVRFFSGPAATAPEPEIWVAAIDGSEDRRLGPGTLARWSPDGRTIAYTRLRHADMPGPTAGSTWLMSARTGRPLRRVWRYAAGSLDWAPDGKRLVATPYGAPGVFILRADGRGARRFTPRGEPNRSRLGEAVDAVWSPDGRRMAFVRDHPVREEPGGEFDDVWEIWTVGVHGARPRRIWHRRLGFDSDSETPPPLSWQPRQR
jgi:Tol biopolymer transport system component